MEEVKKQEACVSFVLQQIVFLCVEKQVYFSVSNNCVLRETWSVLQKTFWVSQKSKNK